MCFRGSILFLIYALTVTAFAQTPAEPAKAIEDVADELLTPEAATRRVKLLESQVAELTVREQGVEYQAQVLRGQYFQALTANSVPSSAFMAPAADPNNAFIDETNLASTNLGAGTRVARTPFIFRAAAQGSVQGFYDTGRVDSDSAVFDPARIAIGGNDAQGAGSFDMINGTGQLKLDLEAEISSEEQAQAYLETFYSSDGILVRNAYGRMRFRVVDVLAGESWTTWADEGTQPRSLSSESSYVAGSNIREKVPQLRLAFPSDSGWVTSIAIQQPTRGNMALRPAVGDDNDQELSRYPELAARIRYFDGEYASLSFGGLWRMMGRQYTDQNEQFEPGWGVSAAARFLLTDKDAVMGGLVGGRGIAGSIFGLATDSLASGNTVSGDLEALGNYGAYAGYQHQFTDNFFSTVAYGFAQVEGSGGELLETQTAENGWANLLYRPNSSFAVGLQYDYGRRELVNSDSGENHRLMFLVAVSTGHDAKQGGAASATAAAPYAPARTQTFGPSGTETAAPPSAGFMAPLPADTGIPKYPRL